MVERVATDGYHHGDLKRDLIRKGLQLLSKEGYESLSLRKVAAMCGVSHAAPYKHFANKDELISAMSLEVSGEFQAVMEGAERLWPDDPLSQLVEMGKRYVEFMVENPDYLDFLFLNNPGPPLRIRDYESNTEDRSPFNVFRMAVMRHLESIGSGDGDWVVTVLTIWSLVHGLATLLAAKSVEYDEGDYRDLVETIIRQKLSLVSACLP